MENIEKIREQIPITKNKVFMNHAAQSPLPKPVADALRKYIDDFSNFGTASTEWNDGGKPLFARMDNYSAIRVYEKIGYKKIGEKLWTDVGTRMKP